MGNVGSGESQIRASPNSIVDTIARASREVARLQQEKQTPLVSSAITLNHDGSDSDDELEDPEEDYDENGVSNTGRSIEPCDPCRPWIISSKEEIDAEIARVQTMKHIFLSNYPGMSSSYLEKLKWAELHSRNTASQRDVGIILRDIVFESAPEDIIVQVLVRKRCLGNILTCDEETAKAFFCSISEPNKLDKESGVPDVLLRPNHPKSVLDVNLTYRTRMENYIKWILEEEQSGTVLSPPVKTDSSSQSGQVKKSRLTCLLNIKAKKGMLLSKGIVEPVTSIIECVPPSRIVKVGPSVLPPQFMTTFLHVESDTKIGCLPHFPAGEMVNNQSVVCAAVEIMMSTPMESNVKTFAKNSSSQKVEEGCSTSTKPNITHENSDGRSSHRGQKENCYLAQLVQTKKNNPGKTFYSWFTRNHKNGGKDDCADAEKTPHVVWLCSYFDHCFPRIQAHYTFGKGEGELVRTKMMPRQQQQPDQSSPTNIKDGIDRFQCQFELLESNFNNIVKNRTRMPMEHTFCELLALTVILAYDDVSWMSSMKEYLEDDDHADNFGDMIEDLGTLWKSMVKNQDEDVGLGLRAWTNAEKAESRRTLLSLLSHLEDTILSRYSGLFPNILSLDFLGSEKTHSSSEQSSKRPLDDSNNTTPEKDAKRPKSS